MSWLGLMAQVPATWLDAVWDRIGPVPEHIVVRAAEIGSVMVRGRISAVGAPFNLGEMTVTRCAVRLRDGTLGYGHVAGRDREKAHRVALLDALLQGPRGAALQAEVLSPLADRLAGTRRSRAAKAAATKVEFFTLVRGED